MLIAGAWAAGVFVFMPVWLFFTGKTVERSLTISPAGISTEIGSFKGQVHWPSVKLVRTTSQVVVIANANGNAFFIPSRAFQTPDHRTQFLAQIDRWRDDAS